MHVLDTTCTPVRYIFLRKIALTFFWILGLLSGTLLVSKLPAVSVSMMRAIALERTSIVGLAISLSFPLLLSVITLRLSMPSLLFPIAFIKAFLFAYSSFGVSLVFGDAGWLLRWLFIFSDSIMVICLLWFWFRNVSGCINSAKRDFVICTLFAVIVFCIDCFIVSPFVMMLFNH